MPACVLGNLFQILVSVLLGELVHAGVFGVFVHSLKYLYMARPCPYRIHRAHILAGVFVGGVTSKWLEWCHTVHTLGVRDLIDYGD